MLILFHLYQMASWYTCKNLRFSFPFTEIEPHQTIDTSQSDKKTPVPQKRKKTSPKQKHQPKQKKTKVSEKGKTITQENFI